MNSPAENSRHFIVLSGRSGSGKTVALRQLEDEGFYCVDNLPTALLEGLLGLTLRGSVPEYWKAAVAVDVRNLDSNVEYVVEIVQSLRDQDGFQASIIYLDADDQTLQQRFNETRRSHPLSSENFSVQAALQREHKLLEPVRRATPLVLRLDTAKLKLHDLRRRIREVIDVDPHGGPSLEFRSFGFKNGVPGDADLVFDVRCLSNPHWQSELRARSGKDQQVAEFLDRQEDVRKMLQATRDWLSEWLACVALENRSYVTVAIGCTGGLHRSVYFCEKLARHFRPQYPGMRVHHRDIPVKAHGG